VSERPERLVRTLWSIEVPERLAVRVSDDDHLEMLGAILDNAAKRVARRSSVTVEGDKDLTVVIDDDGLGASEAHSRP
jgi:hypothetical protein